MYMKTDQLTKKGLEISYQLNHKKPKREHRISQISKKT